MEKLIIIRYGEIFLKGKNRDFFVSLLINNIKHALQDLNYRFVKTQGRYFIEDYDHADEEEIISRLLKVAGIYSISRGICTDTDFDAIKAVAFDLAPDSGSFRVTVKRADKRITQTSTQIAADIGGYIFTNKPNLSVDLFNFDLEINVDIRENGKTLIYTDTILGIGGLPVGCSGNGLLMLSGGIDSPVAGFMMAKRGMRLSAIHFHSMPYTSEQAKEKVLQLAKLVSAYAGRIKVFVVPFTEIQLQIHEKCPSEFMITIMRRFMMRISEIVAKQNGCGAVITGESLGQVASQTLESITSTNSVATIPVFRPLIGFDKNQIIAIANEIGTFETSILPYEDCCTIFLPKNPATRPKLETVVKAENALAVDELIANAVEGIETYVV